MKKNRSGSKGKSKDVGTTDSPTLKLQAPQLRPSVNKEQNYQQQLALKQISERAALLTLKLRAQEQMLKQATHEWRYQPKTMRKYQHILITDPAVRAGLLFTLNRTGQSFSSLSPQQRLQLVKQIQRTNAALATEMQRQLQPVLDPNDPTHPFNQANPNNMTNQSQAAYFSVVVTENNEQTQTNQNENQEADVNKEAETLDAENREQLNQTLTPTPAPTISEEDDDQLLKELSKVGVIAAAGAVIEKGLEGIADMLPALTPK